MPSEPTNERLDWDLINVPDDLGHVFDESSFVFYSKMFFDEIKNKFSDVRTGK